MPLSRPQEPMRSKIPEAVRQLIAGRAGQFDAERMIPRTVIAAMARSGWLGAMIEEKFGGSALDPLEMGRLCESLGRESGSLLSLLTVHSMVSFAVARWGSEHHRRTWLPKLAAGEAIGAFALSESGAGSDVNAISATLRREQGGLVLNGVKKWISVAQLADVFLVVARVEDKVSAVLVPRETPGLTVRPIKDLAGFRAAMLGEVTFSECRVPISNLIASTDFGLAQIVGSVLDQGRYSIAWGAVGLAGACLDASAAHVKSRRQFGHAIAEYQLVQRKITDMVVEQHAARLMCADAAALRRSADPSMISATMMAKYFSAAVAERVAADAVQLHGAAGLLEENPVQRHWRDAKVLNLIEGTAELQQVTIAKQWLQRP